MHTPTPAAGIKQGLGRKESAGLSASSTCLISFNNNSVGLF